MFYTIATSRGSDVLRRLLVDPELDVTLSDGRQVVTFQIAAVAGGRLHLSQFKETGGVSPSLRYDPEADVSTFGSLAPRPFDEPFECLDAGGRRPCLSRNFRVAHEAVQCRRIGPLEFAEDDPIVTETR